MLVELTLTSGMVHYPTLPISEMHLGKFTDSMEFQSWKVNFKKEACTRTANPQITLHWIKEVEIAKSIDELMCGNANTIVRKLHDSTKTSQHATRDPHNDWVGALVQSHPGD